MELKDCLEFANRIKECAVSTAEGNQPHVRILELWFASEEGFYFQTWKFKETYKQLKENPKIEICFYDNNKDARPRMVRAKGEVEFIEDESLRQKVWQDRPYLEKLGAEGPEDKRIIIFKLSHGWINFWPGKSGGGNTGLEALEF